MHDLLVIGAGPGGYEAAAHAAALGKKVALFERQALGGTCLNVGCIPTKTLLRSARAYSDCLHAGAFGVTVAAPTLDMAAVQQRKQKVVSNLGKGIAAMLKGKGVEVINAEASLAGGRSVVAAGKTYEGANILLASGSRPAVPPVPGLAASAAVVDSTGILELTSVPESLLVIGGGVIGLEFACFFAELGCAVTIIEMLPRIAPVIDQEISAMLLKSMRRQKITFHLSSRVSSVDGNSVSFSDASGTAQQLSASVILNATGRVPVLDGLDLAKAGVDYDRRGIKTDAFGKTNVPGIWACGDVTGRCLLAHSATREGIVAVNNMFGGNDRMRFTAVPSVVYTHPEVASVGRSEDDLIADGIAYNKVVAPMAVAGRFLVEYEREIGSVKVLADKEHGHILGVHMIGGGCGEFIAAAAAMVEMELRVAEIDQIIFPHPTVSEALKETIRLLHHA